jgi:hypothetical protein
VKRPCEHGDEPLCSKSKDNLLMLKEYIVDGICSIMSVFMPYVKHEILANIEFCFHQSPGSSNHYKSKTISV